MVGSMRLRDLLGLYSLLCRFISLDDMSPDERQWAVSYHQLVREAISSQTKIPDIDLPEQMNMRLSGRPSPHTDPVLSDVYEALRYDSTTRLMERYGLTSSQEAVELIMNHLGKRLVLKSSFPASSGMSSADLGELYAESLIFRNCFLREQRVWELLSRETLERLKRRYTLQREAEGRDPKQFTIKNARGAGAKPTYTDDEDQRIMKEHRKGRSLRDIAALLDLPYSRVQRCVRRCEGRAAHG